MVVVVSFYRQKCLDAANTLRKILPELFNCPCSMKRTDTRQRCDRIQWRLANNTCLGKRLHGQAPPRMKSLWQHCPCQINVFSGKILSGGRGFCSGQKICPGFTTGRIFGISSRRAQTPATIMGTSLEDSPMTLVSQHAWLHRKIPKGTWGARAPNKRGVGKIGNF